MIKLFLACLIILSNIYAKEAKNDDSTAIHTEVADFFIDLTKEMHDVTTSILDTNLSDAVKLENLTEYVNNLKFDDNFTKEETKFNLSGHKKNFITLVGYDGIDHTETDAAGKEYKRDNNEAQFQISIKTPLYKNFLGTGGTLYGAYTQNSYWQVFDTDHSSPFRETNYMPEAFIDWDYQDKKFGSIYLKKIRATITHQSNGSDLPNSRSWNRNDFMFLFNKNNYYFGFTAWNRWDENAKTDANATEGDDNPDLEKYIGKQKYFIKYKNDRYSVEFSHQNDIFDYKHNYGNTVVDFSFPSFNNNFDFFLRYFNGYGESLIDYNQRVNKISFGILLTDWI